jgi:hypothetical protein
MAWGGWWSPALAATYCGAGKVHGLGGLSPLLVDIAADGEG